MASKRERWARFPDRRPIVALIVAVVASVLVGSSGSVFTAMGQNGWYETLTRPSFVPPGWVFGPVWTTLFVLMGVAAWLVWRQAGSVDSRTASRSRVALGVFVGHFVLNVGWSAAFFGLQSIVAGLVVIVVLWIAILVTIVLFARVDWRAGALLVPYLLWVTFATYLTYGFWTLN